MLTGTSYWKVKTIVSYSFQTAKHDPPSEGRALVERNSLAILAIYWTEALASAARDA